jgi:tetratricopeptide (TPR) repeat protein
LVAYLYKAALFAAAFVAAKDIAANTDITTISYDANFASPFYFALIIASLIAACLFTYLETRTRLTLLFATAEDAEQRRNEEDFKDAALRPVATPSGTGTGGLSTLRAPAQATPATERDETVASVPRQAIQNTNELIGWASAQARKGNLQIAEDAFRDALQRDPDNNDLRLRIADVRRLRHNYTGANELVNEVIDRTSNPTKNSALLQGALYTALYMPPPDGFRQAIALSNKLIEAGEVNDPTLWIWRAAAFGQKYKWLQQNSGTTEELAEARKLALEAITKAIQLSPQYDSAARLLLRALFDPDRERTPKDENDLQVFKGDPEFEQLIHWGKP